MGLASMGESLPPPLWSGGEATRRDPGPPAPPWVCRPADPGTQQEHEVRVRTEILSPHETFSPDTHQDWEDDLIVDVNIVRLLFCASLYWEEV